MVRLTSMVGRPSGFASRSCGAKRGAHGTAQVHQSHIRTERRSECTEQGSARCRVSRERIFQTVSLRRATRLEQRVVHVLKDEVQAPLSAENLEDKAPCASGQHGTFSNALHPLAQAASRGTLGAKECQLQSHSGLQESRCAMRLAHKGSGQQKCGKKWFAAQRGPTSTRAMTFSCCIIRSSLTSRSAVLRTCAARAVGHRDRERSESQGAASAILWPRLGKTRDALSDQAPWMERAAADSPARRQSQTP